MEVRQLALELLLVSELVQLLFIIFRRLSNPVHLQGARHSCRQVSAEQRKVTAATLLHIHSSHISATLREDCLLLPRGYISLAHMDRVHHVPHES